jgi:hypothetical protein
LNYNAFIWIEYFNKIWKLSSQVIFHHCKKKVIFHHIFNFSW